MIELSFLLEKRILPFCGRDERSSCVCQTNGVAARALLAALMCCCAAAASPYSRNGLINQQHFCGDVRRSVEGSDSLQVPGGRSLV